MMKNFSDLTEQELLALAIALEEEESRTYSDLADAMRESYPGTARMFAAMAEEEDGHRHRILDLYSEKFGDHIPLIRRKAEFVMQKSRLPENSHSGKNLRDILHGLPRDELFQTGEDELFQLCMGIRALRDRHQLRLFMRRDRYGRFYSFLV